MKEMYKPFDTRRPMVGNLVTLNNYLDNPAEADGPFFGKVVGIKSKVINSRVVNIYSVLLASGIEVEARYGMIKR